MHDINSITFRLESYLLRLRDTNARWAAWFGQIEQSAIMAELAEMDALESAIKLLMNELSALQSDRRMLIEDAAQAGIQATNLSGVARSLPAWRRDSLRNSLATAKKQLANLKRLHVAAWVLVNQRLQMIRETQEILMLGSLQRTVYSTRAAGDRDCFDRTCGERGGGQLLDASL